MTRAPVVEVRAATKHFGAVRALDAVDLAVVEGSIHALVGENGAGKSSLGKVIGGVIRLDRGKLLVGGQEARYASPADALAHGITTITQEIALLPNQTVLDNVLLGIEATRAGMLDRSTMRRRFDQLTEQTGFDLDPRVRVRDLRLADQKRVEILQAIARQARIIVMDEPTAMLSHDEAREFRKIVIQLRNAGATIIYVSHFLDEVLELADTVTVMRNGAIVATHATSDVTVDLLVQGMIGREISSWFPQVPEVPVDSKVVLEARGISSRIFRGVDLDIRAGEIVGMAGLVGSGRTRLARTLIGVEPKRSGTLKIRDRSVEVRHPSDAVQAGMYYLPESRKEQGLLLKQSIRFNMSLPHLEAIASWLNIVPRRAERRRVEELITALDIRTPGPDSRVLDLSGGNQQKVMFGMWLFEQPQVLIIDEPTRGVDVGAKKAIYDLIVRLAGDGMAILLISSELDEVIALSHRVLVMREAEIVAAFDRAHGGLDEAKIMQAAFGGSGRDANDLHQRGTHV